MDRTGEYHPLLVISSSHFVPGALLGALPVSSFNPYSS